MPDDDGDKPAEPNPDASAPEGGASTSGGATTSNDASAAGASSSDDTSSGASSASDSARADTPSPPRKKKKKKKKRAAAAPSDEEAKDEKPAGPVLTSEGWERPGFLADFPSDPELDRLVRAFELGNYAFVREHGAKLAKSATEHAVRRAAGELVRRTAPDPLVRILFLMSVGLFLFMVFYAYRSHGH